MQQSNHQEASPASTDGSLQPKSPVSQHLIKNLEEQAGIATPRPVVANGGVQLLTQQAAQLAASRPQAQQAMQPQILTSATTGFLQQVAPNIPTGQASQLVNTEQGVIIGEVVAQEKEDGFSTIDYHEFSSQAEGKNEPGASKYEAHLKLNGKYLSDQMQDLIAFLTKHLSERTQGELKRSFASLVVPLNVNGHAVAFAAVGNVFENNTNTTVCALVPSHQGQRITVSDQTFFDIHFGTFTASFSQEAIDEVMTLVQVK